MAEFTLTTPTAVAVNDPVPFNNVVVSGGCMVRHRAGSGIVKVKGGTCCNPKKYTVRFHGYVTGLAAETTFAIYLDGEMLPETMMAVVPVAAADNWSIDASTQILVDCSCQTLSVRNLSAGEVTVTNAALIVE